MSADGEFCLKTGEVPDEGPAKRQFLSRLNPDLIRRTKMFALLRGTTASAVVEQALADFLARQKLTGAARDTPTRGGKS